MRNESASGCRFLYYNPKSTESSPKNFRKTHKTTYGKPKEYWIPKYKLYGDPVLTFILERGEACTPVSCATVIVLCLCILSPYKNRIASFQGIQLCKIVFVPRDSNIRCILHQSCPMKTQHVTTMRNPVIEPVTLYASHRQTVGRSELFIGPRKTYCCVCKSHSAAPVAWDKTQAIQQL